MDELTDKIRDTYRQAAREIRKKLDRFIAAHRKKSAQMLERVKAGKLSKHDYQKWLQGQVFIGERWREKLDDVTRVYVHADKVAREAVGRTAQNEFVRFANQTARDIQHDFGGAVSFDMYDSATVERLLQDNPQMLPEWRIDEPKDYIWNEQRVQNAVTQGIIQGESISDIADRLCNDLATGNARKMDNFARTAVTGAQNAGRIDRMHQAQNMGIRVRKKWLAAHDNRVRDSHAQLDGQEADVDEDFVTINGNHIAFPGDPSAPPEEVYNCRCTLLYVYPDFEKSAQVINKETEEHQTQANDAQQESFAEGFVGQQLSPYQYDYRDFGEYIEATRSYQGETTKYIEDVYPGMSEVRFGNGQRIYGGVEYCDARQIDNAVARMQEKFPLIGKDRLILCDYEDAWQYLPDGRDDRRFILGSGDSVAQVFQNEGQTVIAFTRSSMTGTIEESLKSRKQELASGRPLFRVFPVDSPETIVMHEWGHTVSNYYTHGLVYDDPDAKALFEWWKGLSQDDISHGVSTYAATSFGEFQAECFAEMQAPNPRPMARQFWSYMERIISRSDQYAY